MFNVYKYSFAHNCKKNIAFSLLHCTANNMKIHVPYDMYDNYYSQNTCCGGDLLVALRAVAPFFFIPPVFKVHSQPSCATARFAVL